MQTPSRSNSLCLSSLKPLMTSFLQEDESKDRSTDAPSDAYEQYHKEATHDFPLQTPTDSEFNTQTIMMHSPGYGEELETERRFPPELSEEENIADISDLVPDYLQHEEQQKLSSNRLLSKEEERRSYTPSRQPLDLPFSIEEVKSRCSSNSTTDIERATPNRQFCLSPVLKQTTKSKYQAAFRERVERRASVLQKSEQKVKLKHAFHGGICNPFRSVTPHSRESTGALQKRKAPKKSDPILPKSRETKPQTVRTNQAKVGAHRPSFVGNRERAGTVVAASQKTAHKFQRGVSFSKKGEKSFSRLITLRNYYSNMLKVPFRKWIKKLYNYEMILKFCYKRVVPIIERAYLKFRKVKKVKQALQKYVCKWKKRRERRNALLLAILRGWRVRRALKESEMRIIAAQIKTEEGMIRKVKVLNFILEMHKREQPFEKGKAWEEIQAKGKKEIGDQERKVMKEDDRIRCFRNKQELKSKAVRSQEVLSPVPENTQKPKFVKKINFFPREKSQGGDSDGQYRQLSKREETKRLRKVEKGEGALQKQLSVGREKIKAKGWREAHARFETSTKENRIKHSLNAARSESRKAKKLREEEKVLGPKLNLGHIGATSLTSPISPQSGFQRKSGSKLSLISTPTGVKNAFIGRKIQKSLNRIKQEKAKVAQWKRSINSSLLDHTSSSLNKVQKPKAGAKARRKTDVAKDGKESKILGRISDLFQVVKSKQKNKVEAQSQFQNLMKELQQHLEKECQD